MNNSTFRNFLVNPRNLLILWGVVAVVCALLKLSLGAGEYNNFMIFRGVADHFFSQQPLYVPYPAEYHDINHYGPMFAFIIAPFAAMPVWLAMPLWVVGSSMLLLWAVRNLPVESRLQSVILWIALNDLFGAGAMQQFNIMVAAMMVGSYVMIEKRKEGWAAFFIVVGTFAKIYGIIGLALFFFVRRKWRFIFYLILWSAVALLLPLFFVTPEYLWIQYSTWLFDLSAKNAENQFSFLQNISFVGTVRKISNSATYSDLWIIIPAILLFCSTYLRVRQYKNPGFRMMTLGSLMIFVVIFSSGSENSGYIIAAIGVGLWWVALKRRGPLEWTLLVLVVIASFSRNLFPDCIYRPYIIGYALRSIPYTAVWLHAIWQMWRIDFTPIQGPKTDYSNADIDVVLPCYNPHEGWVNEVTDNFGKLKIQCPTHKFRLIVSNDGSKCGFHEYIDALRIAIPDVVVVDNVINRGKGAAVRAGVEVTTAPIIVYTDYDFPYRTECMNELITKLSIDQYDIVLATRNHTYHNELSPLRKMLSWASRNLNWAVLGMSCPDAQGGLKGFNAKGRELFLKTKINRFLFDTEFIYKASRCPVVRIGQITATLREGIHLPAMSVKTMRREAVNFLKILFSF